MKQKGLSCLGTGGKFCNKMEEIVIVGAGAIGRGFLEWVLDTASYELVFVDKKKDLVTELNRRKQYRTYRTKAGVLEEKLVAVKEACHISEFSPEKHNRASAVFVNVGPRNCVEAASHLKGIKCPIVLCENEPQTVEEVKYALNYERVYFAVPDVITSNTASPDILSRDPISVITEDGVLFVDEKAGNIKGSMVLCSGKELSKQWTAKLYLHNTPHCIAAYVGALMGMHYVHEAMNIERIREIVVGSMNEMLDALKLRWDIPHEFLDWYADKEIKRFSNKLLYDPVSRVAREPLRKLGLGGRLIGAAQICLSQGFVPKNILTGIVSALLFENEEDADYHLRFMRKSVSEDVLLHYILGLREGEALEIIMKERLAKIISEVEDMIKNPKKVHA
ncbi:MAG: mannitol-1-phosphate 5-dehydrogenase [Candidatus Omnitrophica bacterium]|nr:mannitol-1-phosphate 5-dehydrogenase [Candidatus Omnitrophota bacterium]